MNNRPRPQWVPLFALLTEYIIALRRSFTYLCAGLAGRNTSHQADGSANDEISERDQR